MPPRKRFAPALVLLCSLLLIGCKGEELTLEQKVRESYDLAERWFTSSLRDKGLFLYIYDPRSDSISTKNNAIRQLMASRLLADLSRSKPDLKDLHLKNLDFLFTHWYREEGEIGYVFYDKESKLGANAMLLRTIVYSPFYDEYAEQARRLAEGILSIQGEDGAFRAFLKEPSDPYDEDYLLTFYSGEAILSLLEYYGKTEEQRWLDAAVLSQDYYLDPYVTHLSEHYYPAYVPWHTQSLSLLFRLTGDRRYADAITVLNDELLEILDTRKYVGRFYNPSFPEYGNPHASSDGVYTEGLAYAYEIALLTGDTAHADRYRQALEIAVSNLISLQYTGREARKFPNPDRVIGALRINVSNPRVRIDTTQHTMDAFRKMLEVFSGSSPSIRETAG